MQVREDTLDPADIGPKRTPSTDRPSGWRVRDFYDQIGWKARGDRAVDSQLFSYREDGPLRQELHRLHVGRIQAAIRRVGAPVKLLECGCGGNPASELLELCTTYHGADFSATGLALAEARLQSSKVPVSLREADVCHLPFGDGSFDAVYCAHVLYHISDRADQRRVLSEMIRVLRPGGVLVLVTANPRPLLFPVRLARRVLADLPWASRMAVSLGYRRVLPYLPPSLGWCRRMLALHGRVEVIASSLPSTFFNQTVSEFHGAGKWLWRWIRYLDVSFPRLAAYLGNYAQITLLKAS